MDDMQEYIRGLFVIMYCLPSTILAYLYIRTSRDLKAPEGPLGVMMFEVRSSIRHKRLFHHKAQNKISGLKLKCGQLKLKFQSQTFQTQAQNLLNGQKPL
uniref:CSON015239 protein n=1 Tax=Culicoides sonorensis TaxID=179676 RepID=A0A336MDZ4_CULSO